MIYTHALSIYRYTTRVVYYSCVYSCTYGRSRLLRDYRRNQSRVHYCIYGWSKIVQLWTLSFRWIIHFWYFWKKINVEANDRVRTSEGRYFFRYWLNLSRFFKYNFKFLDDHFPESSIKNILPFWYCTTRVLSSTAYYSNTNSMELFEIIFKICMKFCHNGSIQMVRI